MVYRDSRIPGIPYMATELPTYLQVESHLPLSVSASTEMIPSSSIHLPSSDPALAEDTPLFVSSLTSEQRAYILHLSRLSHARQTMSPERLLAVTEKVNNEIRNFEQSILANSTNTISATPDPLVVNQRTLRLASKISKRSRNK